MTPTPRARLAVPVLAFASLVSLGARAWADGPPSARAGASSASETERARAERVEAARRRLATLPPHAHAARVATARALIDLGADDAAREELDRVLRADAGQRDALALLATRPPRVDVDALLGSVAERPGAAREACLRAGARECSHAGSAVRREAIVDRLVAFAGDAERAETTRVLLAELDSGTNSRRAFACHALRRLAARTHAAATREAASVAAPAAPATPETRETTAITTTTTTPAPPAQPLPVFPAIAPLAVRAVLDPAIEVRDAAAIALRDADDVRAVALLVQALANPHASVRVRALEALARTESTAAIEPLIRVLAAASAAASPASAAGGGGGPGGPVRGNLYVGLETAYVQDFDVQIAQGSSIADPIVRTLTTGTVFDVGVGGVSVQPVSIEAWTAARALTRITGEPLGTDASLWQRWWRENRARFVPGAVPERTGEPR